MKKVVFLISVLLLCSCGGKTSNFKVGYSSNIITSNEKKELRKIFEDNNISNVDLFFKWLENFNKEEDMGCGIKSNDKTDNFVYNEASCIDRYEKNHDMMDGNCRITAYALIQNIISNNTPKKEEYGSYLMFDIDVLENNKDYKEINKNQLEFINLFNEIDVSNVDKKDYKNVFPNKLKDNNINFKNSKVSLISVVLNDSEFNILFVGHAGVLIDLDDKYLFVEKIAFEQPYQISVIETKKDLSNLFKNRLSYFGDDSEQGPYIYENDKLIYEYE